MCMGTRVYLGATWSIIPGVGILLRIVAQYINACSKQIRVMPGGGDQQRRGPCADEGVIRVCANRQYGLDFRFPAVHVELLPRTTRSDRLSNS